MKSRDITPAMYDRMPYPVKTYIQLLEMRNQEKDELIRRLRTIGSNNTSNGIVLDPHSEYPIVFNEDNAVRFWVEPGVFYLDMKIKKDRRGTGSGPALDVCGGGFACTGFIGIRPNSGNTIEIFKETR